MQFDPTKSVDLHLRTTTSLHDVPGSRGKEAHFEALRTFLAEMGQFITEKDDLTVTNFNTRFDELEGDSLYWAPEMFQFKLMPFVLRLTALLNDRFEENRVVAVAWERFLVGWTTANKSTADTPTPTAEPNTVVADINSPPVDPSTPIAEVNTSMMEPHAPTVDG